MAAKYAVSLMALLGSVAAQGYNSSSIASTTSSSVNPQYTNGAEPTVGGTTFLIQSDTSYSDATVLTLSRKRQATSGIASCLATCSDSDRCVGTSYSDDSMQCTYYSDIDTATQTKTAGTDFALVQSRANASTTSDVFNGTTPVTSGGATRTSGVSLSSGAAGNSTTRATGSSTRSAGVSLSSGVSGNSTRSASASRTSSGAVSTTSGSAASPSPSSLLSINGVLFLIEIDIDYTGIEITLTILAKRAGQSLDQCLTTCAANTNCAATSFTEADGTCTFFSSVDAGSRVSADGTTFATVISRAGAGNGSGTNGTSPTTNGTTPAIPSNVTAESFICPRLDGSVLLSNVDVTFAISCSSFLIGTTYDAVAEIQQKRQAIDNGLPSTLSNCVDLCSVAESCVGTTFNIATETCAFYNDVDYATDVAGYDSAVRVQDNSGNGNGNGSGEVATTTVLAPGVTTTVIVAAPTTATIYQTIVSTVTVIAGGAGQTVYPGGAVVTSISSVGQVTYTNTVPTVTIPQNGNAAVPTVTITIGGAGTAVATQVVTVTVDQNGNVIGQSTAGAAAGGAGGAGSGAYPTVTVHDVSTVSVCPTTADSVVWTTVYVR
ncbi:hypothetical protein AUEXF2481DRAFT_28546 [Aureobasidium subglaciale EXF-2481]|uniref:Apple domain-containing protein n=1 Tax=Aureobasidium subglaciale (strain EXF-2481) TaxID=1043005 RepID=A0A074YRD0_AURSE|nr:uncharacterized protein AUEXF2481DRAFT_28546 [Aureobasidium subglaciale EXF-2481]KAI5201047.1 hypothetical protein E4T38_06273 [Aureobasidium subglaciale]KAI5219656.1 hypothetical protein E4T40_06269 [Aureobasidium subglaciale]KAI5223436.1 hypothetical protein E4T41_06109 [Aureobasidium subglaciale]KAI5260464.1 hypothetical protein E4T46_06028 [Aureobasidium subglaciale]KEQ96617.1 hypothetical protein AUEXF2481DRAFT_28546 [Aureobasidium subglaciale EXF-2481]